MIATDETTKLAGVRANAGRADASSGSLDGASAGGDTL